MQKKSQKIFDVFDQINNDIPLDAIRLTAGQFSLILKAPNKSIPYDTIVKAGELINADSFTMIILYYHYMRKHTMMNKSMKMFYF